MSVVINPALIEDLKAHYRNPVGYGGGKTPLAVICEKYGLRHPGNEVFGSRDNETKDAQFTVSPRAPLQTAYQRTVSMLKHPDKSPDQDAMNLYLEVLHSSRSDHGYGLIDMKGSRKKFKKIFQGELSNASIRDVFNRLHQYGLTELLEANLSDDRNVLPKSLRQKYEDWMLGNNVALPTKTISSPSLADVTIKGKQKIFNDLSAQEMLDILATGTGVNPSGKSFIDSDIALTNILPGLSAKSWVRKQWQFINGSDWDDNLKKCHYIRILMESNKRGYDRKRAIGRIGGHGNESAMRNLWENGFSLENRGYHFQCALTYNFLPELYFLINTTDSYFPKETSAQLKKWCASKGVDLTHMLATYKFPGEWPLPEPAPQIAPASMVGPAAPDLDAIIAEKQKFFNETPSIALDKAFQRKLKINIDDFEKLATDEYHPLAFLSTTTQFDNNGLKDQLKKTSRFNISENEKLFLNIHTFILSKKSRVDEAASIHIGAREETIAKARTMTQNAWNRYFLDQNKIEYVFNGAHLKGYLAEFYFIANSNDTFIPEGISQQLEKWCDTKGINLKQILADYELPHLAPEPPAAEVDFDAIIAEKQKFFDETHPLAIIGSFGTYRFGISHEIHDPKLKAINDVIAEGSYETMAKRTWRFIGQQPWDQNVKTFEYIMNLIGSTARGTALKVERGLNSSMMPTERAKAIWSAFSIPDTRNYLFEAARRNNFLPELYFHANMHDTHIPAGTTDHLLEWCETKGINLKQMLVGYELPEMPAAEPTPEPVTPADEPEELEELETADLLDPDIYGEDIEIIDVPGLLIEAGQGNMPGHESPSAGPGTPRPYQPRIKWLIDGLRPHVAPEKGSIKVFRPANWSEQGPHGDTAHRIIQITDKDGEIHQIAVNNYYGGGTYVLKPVVPITATRFEPLKIPALLGAHFKENISPDTVRAWPIRCYEGKQQKYADDAWEICKTPLGELAPYIPRIGWVDKREEALLVCRDLMMKTGQRVKTSDRTPVMIDYTEEGPVYTTMGRLAAAIRHGAIGGAGLRNIEKMNGKITEEERRDIPSDNLHAFYTQLLIKYPELCDRYKNPAVHAKFVFHSVASITRETGIVPQRDILKGITLAGFPAEKVDAFFGGYGGRIVGLKSLGLHEGAAPSSLDDFTKAANLAVEDDGMLHPNWSHHDLAGSQHAPR